MKISKILGIKKSQAELDFFDYETTRDNYKFIDPYYISKQEDSFLCECNEYIVSFFNKFISLLKKGKDLEAYELFKHLSEVNEICLGMSKGKPSGKGIGKIDTENIFKAIKKSKAYELGVAKTIEDVRIFIPGIDKDKISDMVANIIKKPLLKYTQQQCHLYGFSLSKEETGYYWDKKDWVRGHADMICHKGNKYLLYPRNLVTSSKWFSSQEFFTKYILEYYRNKFLEEDASIVNYKYDKDGKVIEKSLSKDDVEQYLKKDNTLDKQWIEKFAIDHPDIYNDFKQKAIIKLKLKESEVEKVLNDNDLIDYLISEFDNIKPGNDDSKKYQIFICGVLELLFYPNIAHPVIENEIHEGRKRIDINFNNISNNGFFFQLGTIYDIPCSNIIIECKNYSKDISNPELDQIAGRFSSRRGKFGIICCRSLNNKELFEKREIDTYRDDRGLIFNLTDEDFKFMLTIKKDNKDPETYLTEKYFRIVNQS